MKLTNEELDALWPERTLMHKVVRREIARTAIAANNAKVLADLKPLAMVAYGGKWENWYSAEQVSVLIQRVQELEGVCKGVIEGFIAEGYESFLRRGLCFK